MVSVKEVPQIGDRIYIDFRECCEDQKVPYRWVCNKMLQEGVSVQDAVRYYKRKQEKKLQKAQKQVPVKGKMLEPQPVNVLGLASVSSGCTGSVLPDGRCGSDQKSEYVCAQPFLYKII